MGPLVLPLPRTNISLVTAWSKHLSVGLARLDSQVFKQAFESMIEQQLQEPRSESPSDLSEVFCKARKITSPLELRGGNPVCFIFSKRACVHFRVPFWGWLKGKLKGKRLFCRSPHTYYQGLNNCSHFCDH